VLAVLYAAVCAAESIALPYNQAANASASAEFAIAWSFALCVLVLGGMAGVAAWDAARGALAPRRHGLLSLAAYAGLLAAGWPLVAFTLYVGPRIV